jgi:hypothetical protein
MVVAYLAVEIDHVVIGGFVAGILHARREGLAQRRADQGDEPGVDVDSQGMPSCRDS